VDAERRRDAAGPDRPDDIVHFRMYDPANPVLGFPPIETLRTLLAERAAAANYRRAFWQNGARFETVITRPAAAPKWEPNDRSRTSAAAGRSSAVPASAPG
jgi:phage portal protein BeeE